MNRSLSKLDHNPYQAARPMSL